MNNRFIDSAPARIGLGAAVYGCVAVTGVMSASFWYLTAQRIPTDEPWMEWVALIAMVALIGLALITKVIGLFAYERGRVFAEKGHTAEARLTFAIVAFCVAWNLVGSFGFKFTATNLEASTIEQVETEADEARLRAEAAEKAMMRADEAYTRAKISLDAKAARLEADLASLPFDWVQRRDALEAELEASLEAGEASLLSLAVARDAASQAHAEADLGWRKAQARLAERTAEAPMWLTLLKESGFVILFLFFEALDTYGRTLLMAPLPSRAKTGQPRRQPRQAGGEPDPDGEASLEAEAEAGEAEAEAGQADKVAHLDRYRRLAKALGKRPEALTKGDKLRLSGLIRCHGEDRALQMIASEANQSSLKLSAA